MEVVVPVPEFHFHTAMNTPNISAPSSPPNHFTDNSTFSEFHRHISAPNSPTSSAAIYAAFRKSAAASRGSRHSSVPFDWEEKPGTPKFASFDEKEDDFDFDFSFGFGGRQIDKVSQPLPASSEKAAIFATADELFESGKIRPLKPPPRLYSPVMGEQVTKSPRSGGFLSSLRRGRNQRGKELDPFVLAMVEATKSRRGSRSLSPFGGREKGGSFLTPASSPPRNPTPMAETGGRGWKYWLKDFLLFRSSSEGRVTVERKKNDFSKYGSSSSSSSTSSSGSAKGKTEFSVSGGGGGGCGESSCSSFRSEESGSTRRGAVVPQEMQCTWSRTAVVVEKKMVVPCKLSMFSGVRSFTAGKFGVLLIRRRT